MNYFWLISYPTLPKGLRAARIQLPGSNRRQPAGTAGTGSEFEFQQSYGNVQVVVAETIAATLPDPEEPAPQVQQSTDLTAKPMRHCQMERPWLEELAVTMHPTILVVAKFASIGAVPRSRRKLGPALPDRNRRR